MNKLDEMNGLVLTAEQILENIKAIRDKPEEPELYDGLTEEQWKIVIDEKLICAFWDDAKQCSSLGIVISLTPTTRLPFAKRRGGLWTHCKIHESQPQFCNGTRPEGLDDDEIVLIREIDGFVTILMPVADIEWSLIKRWQRVKI